MINKLQHTFSNATAADINRTLRSIGMYAWISAGVLFGCYLYFVGAITFSVIKERGLRAETKTLISQMGEEELAYLSAQKNLTESYAASIGFVKPTHISFNAPKRALAWNVGR